MTGHRLNKRTPVNVSGLTTKAYLDKGTPSGIYLAAHQKKPLDHIVLESSTVAAFQHPSLTPFRIEFMSESEKGK